ncbi:MAG: ABC transporter ATP-binding protein [Actinobacteria bacterium]|nr:ABC transporter ATP-binding protein [Actinomycetota bacterium]
MTATSLVIDADGLTKHYGRKVGCEEVCLRVRRGHIFGFLGPNGAGKSTFVKMMVGLIAPTSGRAEVLGRPLGDLGARTGIGFLPEVFRYQDWLTASELLRLHGRLAGMESGAIAESSKRVLNLVGLKSQDSGKIRSFSKGMTQRLGLACALLADPDLVILDEPTSALDPLGRYEVREILLSARERGVTVFLNSHLLTEVESVCDEVAVIDHGRVIESGPLSALLSGPCEVEITLAEPFAGAALRLRPLEASVLVDEPLRLVAGLPDESRIPGLVERLVSEGARVTGVVRRRRTLEALFLDAVKEAQNARRE